MEASPNNVMAVARKLRDIASSENGRALVERGMQNNMVAMLKNPNENVVQSSLEALFFLSNNPENKKALAQTKGLPEGVSALRKSSSHSLRSVADAILNNLQEFLAPALHPSTNTQQRSTIRAEAPVKPANPAPVQQIAPKTFCIQVPEGQLEERAYLDKQMVRCPGVISIQVSVETNTIILCAAKQPAEVKQLLESADVYVTLDDIKESTGMEDAALNQANNKENTPTYATPTAAPTGNSSSKSMSRVKISSLQARVDQKFRKEKKQEVQGWASSIKSSLSGWLW